MIIVFANQKGGVGKSTHCALFAQYLSEKDKEVHVIDMDYQKTLQRMREIDVSIMNKRNEEENIFDNSLNYSVNYVSEEKVLSFLEIAEREKEKVFLFDMPGNLGRDNIIRTLAKANFIITPFQYENATLNSTAQLMQVKKKFDLQAQSIFLPTNIDVRVKNPNIDKANQLLMTVGVLAPVVYQRNEFKNFSTIGMTKLLKELVQPTYDFIYNVIFG